MKIDMKLPSMFKLKPAFLRLIQNRGSIFGIYLLAFLPTLFLAFAILHQKEEFEEIQGRIDCLAIKMERFKEIQKDKNTFLKTYQFIDPYYVDHALESMRFLQPEMEALKLVMHTPPFETCTEMKQRFLTLEKNTLMFSEGTRKASGKLEEVELTQKRPVELNIHDLKNLLSKIEGIEIDDEKVPEGRPQMIIKDFVLNKKKLAERETYQLEMQLIKRGIVL